MKLVVDWDERYPCLIMHEPYEWSRVGSLYEIPDELWERYRRAEAEVNAVDEEVRKLLGVKMERPYLFGPRKGRQ